VDFSNAVNLSRIEEDTLSGRGFSGVDMRHDSDVTQVF
jgi:hypothetical protein